MSPDVDAPFAFVSENETERSGSDTRASVIIAEPKDTTRVIQYSGLARAFYAHDQRIEFTGNESTFAVESQLWGSLSEELAECRLNVTGELYFTQPFDRNVLVDYPLRESFSHNFDVDTVEISQLSIGASRGDWTVELGRFVTPFGRYYGTIQTNSRNDVPFIRSESILFRETGILFRYEPGRFRLATALINGSDGRDTNSSKGFIVRLGLEDEQFSFGASIKKQDGIGSEGQKEFNNHIGIDVMRRLGRLSVSAEVIYDEYGLRRPGFDLDQITWGRSIYNRQLNRGLNRPLSGWGFYTNVVYQTACWNWEAGYGEFHPTPLGLNTLDSNIHDAVNRRLIGRASRALSENFHTYLMVMLENPLENGLAGRPRHGFYLLSGAEFKF